MKAMIFAAGLGTRLKPLTDTMPKALVPVGGEPLLSRVVSGLQAQGIDDFVINVHHFPDQIIDFIKEKYPDTPVFQISDEREKLLETGGGIKKAGAMLMGSGRFLVHNVDIISNFALPGLLAAAPADALATLLVSERKTNRYFLFDDTMRLVGWTNISTGELRSPFREIDPDKCHKLAFSGIHLVSDKIFEIMSTWPERFSIVDFYLSVAAEYPIFGHKQDNLQLMDVGKIDILDQANDFTSFLSNFAVR